MDIVKFFSADSADAVTTASLDWTQREDVCTARAILWEAGHRLDTARARRLDVWDWKTSDDPHLRLAHFTQWPPADLEFREAELHLHESQTALTQVEAEAKASVREAWEQLFTKAFASVEEVALGELSDRLRELGELWDRANELRIVLPVALCDVTMSPQGLREWAQAVRQSLGE